MSLLNAWISPNEAIIYVDTDGVRQDGKRTRFSKVLPIPHLNAAVAMRGQMAMMTGLFMKLSTSGFESFDEMNEVLPVLIANVERDLPLNLIDQNFPIGNEILVVGWSDKESRMLGRQFMKRDSMAEYADRLVDFHISPWHASMPELPKSANAVDFISRLQVKWMRETFPNAACGGDLLMCMVSREGIVVTRKYAFPMAEAA